jgi:hypothetical protein
MTHVAAFQQLEAAIAERGQEYVRGQIIGKPADADEVVGRGLEAGKQLQLPYGHTFLPGVLSVRGLVAKEGVSDPFCVAEPAAADAARFMVRSRLDFEVLRGRGRILDLGQHSVMAVYVLGASAPDAFDRFFKSADGSETTPPGTIQNSYPHLINGRLAAPLDSDKRTELLRRWIPESSEADGMAMLSATKGGAISATELPRTIGWLLQAAAAEA